MRGLGIDIVHRGKCGFVTVASAMLVASCSSGFQPPAPPTVAETQAYIARMVQLAQAEEFEQLCAMGGALCEDILDTAGAENVPVDPPTIARIYVVPNVHNADGSWSVGGRMVEMCGTDRSGARYKTQMLVFRDPQEGVIAIQPIYWSGIGIITGGPGSVVGAGKPDFAC